MKPEMRIAVAKRATHKDVKEEPSLTLEDIGRWIVIGTGGVVRCDSYREASEIASSFNRCPA